MARCFFDTSALVKYYHAESGMAAVTRLMSARQNLISILGFVEAQPAFAMKVRSEEVSKDAAGLLRARLPLDIAAGNLNVITLTRRHFEAAARLIGKYSFTHRCRTLDALQLAAVSDLAQQQLVDHFVVADQALFEVATLEGIPALNPISPTPTP